MFAFTNVLCSKHFNVIKCNYCILLCSIQIAKTVYFVFKLTALFILILKGRGIGVPYISGIIQSDTPLFR